MTGAPPWRLATRRAAFGRHALAQRVHEINYFCRFAPLNVPDLLARLLLANEVLERVFVMILEGPWLEMPDLRGDDM